MTLIFLPIWHFFALLNELENQYLHERKKTSNLFTTIDFDMKSLKTLRMISKAIRNTTASGFLSPQLLFFANNARMQVHISLTHIHFTLPNDCFYIAPFSVRKTQVYVCTNQCDRSRACPQYRACVPLFMPGLGSNTWPKYRAWL